MKVNGIEVIGEGIHPAVLARVADAALGLGVYWTEQDGGREEYGMVP